MMMVIDENLRDRKSYYNSSRGEHTFVYQISWPSMNTYTCWDISLKNKNVNLLVTLEEKSGDHQSQ